MNLCKRVIFAAFAITCSMETDIFSHPAWFIRTLDTIGIVSSSFSALVWTPPMLHVIAQGGIIGAIKSTHILRVALDVCAIGLGVAAMKGKANGMINTPLNVIVLLGSITSLATWLPIIYADLFDRYGLRTSRFRGGIDILQIGLCLQRLTSL